MLQSQVQTIELTFPDGTKQIVSGGWSDYHNFFSCEIITDRVRKAAVLVGYSKRKRARDRELVFVEDFPTTLLHRKEYYVQMAFPTETRHNIDGIDTLELRYYAKVSHCVYLQVQKHETNVEFEQMLQKARIE